MVKYLGTGSLDAARLPWVLSKTLRHIRMDRGNLKPDMFGKS